MKRLTLTIACLSLCYFAPVFVRLLMFGRTYFSIGFVLCALVGWLGLRLVTNDGRFGALVYCGCAVAEGVLLATTRNFVLAVAIGCLAPALTLTYFANRLSSGLGD